MTDPEVAVTLTDTVFTLGELDDFVARARAIDGMPNNATVCVVATQTASGVQMAQSEGGKHTFALIASTEWAEKQ